MRQLCLSRCLVWLRWSNFEADTCKKEAPYEGLFPQWKPGLSMIVWELFSRLICCYSGQGFSILEPILFFMKFRMKLNRNSKQMFYHIFKDLVYALANRNRLSSLKLILILIPWLLMRSTWGFTWILAIWIFLFVKC